MNIRNLKAIATLVFIGLTVSSCQTTHETNSVLGEDGAKSGVSSEQIHQIGRDMSLAFLKKHALVDDENVSLYLNHVGQYVAAHLDPGAKNIKCASGKPKSSPWNGFRFAVVKSSDRISMAIPGGFVFVSSALIQDLKTEDELAGVLAHEATHIVCQDGLAEVEKALAGANVETARDLSAKAYATYFRYTFNMAQEKIADRGSLLALYRGGYFPSDYIDFVGGLKEHPVPRHKTNSNRVGWMKKDFAKMQQKGVANTQKARVARFTEFKKQVGK